VVLGLFGGELLDRCLESLRRQRGVGDMEVLLVACGQPPVPDRLGGARLLSSGPLLDLPERAAAALATCRGRFVLLVEDQAALPEDGARRLIDRLGNGRAAVGGGVALAAAASPAEWALYFADFFRYAHPCPTGPSSALTVSNVCYRREALSAIEETLALGFLETTAHEARAARFGELWLEGAVQAIVPPRGPLAAGVRERCGLGRSYAVVRTRAWPSWRRWLYALGSPLLPALFLARLARRAGGTPELRRPFVRSLGPLLLLVTAWGWGELAGYATGRPPGAVALARPRL
jgi:hypothetical protein